MTIPGSVTSIGYYAFYGCSSLACAIVDGKTELSDQMFFNCPSLREIWMPAYTVDEVVGHIAPDEYGYSDWWWMGSTSEKLVMVIIYCMDGTVVVNANDDSSGESSGS